MSGLINTSYVELAELAGGFIHEIKNHLNTLSLNIQLLSEEFETPETQKERRAAERLHRLGDECRKLVDLSNDFLRFAKIEDLRYEQVDIVTVVSRMVDFFGPTAKAKKIEVNWYPISDLPHIPLDVDMFEKVLLNLLLNADDAMPSGGQLTLLVRIDREKVYLDIIDTGVGIPQEVLPKLFKPFVTTKENGNGLGLATARKIIQAHGGDINVQSAEGLGTKFTVSLPIFVPLFTPMRAALPQAASS
jgi:two-component system, NtrC family, sensor histidine kinase HydH